MVDLFCSDTKTAEGLIYLAFRYVLRERVMGIEPTYTAWKAVILPLNYTRNGDSYIIMPGFLCQEKICDLLFLNIFFEVLRLFYAFLQIPYFCCPWTWSRVYSVENKNKRNKCG